MQVIDNTIIFPGFIVICDAEIAQQDPEYILQMAEELELEDDQTPRGIARALRNMNNDGSWGLKINK